MRMVLRLDMAIAWVRSLTTRFAYCSLMATHLGYDLLRHLRDTSFEHSYLNEPSRLLTEDMQCSYVAAPDKQTLLSIFFHSPFLHPPLNGTCIIHGVPVSSSNTGSNHVVQLTSEINGRIGSYPPFLDKRRSMLLLLRRLKQPLDDSLLRELRDRGLESPILSLS